ncbi:MAG: hypothetical protein GTO14_02240 [Anaerolineales bacterium]|nr:hypothetical protein [Anaerolineales bacterium]
MSKQLGRNWALLGGMLLMIFGVGCGFSREVTIGLEHDGQEIQLDIGEVLVLELESNPTTGYVWEVDEIDEMLLRLQGEPAYKASSGREFVGAGGVEVFRFEALSSGVAVLELIYHRPWEEEKPIKTFSVRVVMQ